MRNLLDLIVLISSRIKKELRLCDWMRTAAFGKITNRFYHALYDHIFNGGELFMKPEHVKAQAAIMCEVERHNPLELKFDKPE